MISVSPSLLFYNLAYLRILLSIRGGGKLSSANFSEVSGNNSHLPRINNASRSNLLSKIVHSFIAHS
ncbi:hypothetical protein ABG067_003807 [Albugo candida]|uniref:Uncharacterized protein n=1 Tax=Albugo candida TaxID=65357 RepID=A0A024GCP4_9STRA|nr:unnamed protein product [Albugo candida]|eukprot:CCI44301.1 unnamed protein product [Albugo candida]